MYQQLQQLLRHGTQFDKLGVNPSCTLESNTEITNNHIIGEGEVK